MIDHLVQEFKFGVPEEGSSDSSLKPFTNFLKKKLATCKAIVILSHDLAPDNIEQLTEMDFFTGEIALWNHLKHAGIIRTTSWEHGLHTLLHQCTDSQPQSRSCSPSQGWPSSRSSAEPSPKSIHIIDIKALYNHMLKSTASMSIAQIAQKLGLDAEPDEWCAGNDVV
jgi:hypothetical protein